MTAVPDDATMVEKFPGFEQIGLFAGSGTMDDGKPNMMWEDLLTREQAAQLFYRFSKILGVG